MTSLLPVFLIFPLAALFVRAKGAHLITVSLGWLILAGALFYSQSFHLKMLVMSLIPTHGFINWLSFFYYKKQQQLQMEPEESNKINLIELREQHRFLKEEVTKEERKESQSLQIYGVAKSLAEALSWKDMAPRLTTGIQKIFGAYEFLLYAVDPEKGWQLLHRRGNWLQEPPVDGSLSEVAQVFSAPAVRELVPVFGVPIHQGDQKLNGVLFFKSSESDRTEMELLQAGNEFGEQLGLAISKALLFTRMERQSRVDGLTGTLRRQTFMDRLEQEFKRAALFHTPFSLMMVDIDHFKAINDRHGHAAGDAVLARIGNILKESFYETDVVGRYGGEEFMVLLPRSQADGVLRKAEILRNKIEREMIAFGFEKLRVTVSIGLSRYPDHGKSTQELIERADQALYQAKDTGRNRVVASGIF